jgi:hypothetical protein
METTSSHDRQKVKFPYDFDKSSVFDNLHLNPHPQFQKDPLDMDIKEIEMMAVITFNELPEDSLFFLE